MKPHRRDWVSLVLAVIVSYAGIVLAESTVSHAASNGSDSWQIVADAPVPLP